MDAGQHKANQQNNSVDALKLFHLISRSALASAFAGIHRILDFRFWISDCWSSDYSVSSGQYVRWNSQSDLLGSLEIDDQLEFCWLLDRKVGGLRAF
jgi:hypothetical protein